MLRTVAPMFERLTSFVYGGMDLSFVPRTGDVEVVKALARRLMGRSVAETLNNVLEWMEKNLTYWWERAYIDMVASIFLYIGLTIIAFLISLPVLVILFVLFATILKLPPLIALIASSIATVALLIYFVAKMSPF